VYSLSIFVLCDVSPEFPRGFASVQIPVQFEGRNLPLGQLRSVVDAEMEAIGMDRGAILSVRCLLLNSEGKVRFDGFAYRSTPEDAYVVCELLPPSCENSPESLLLSDDDYVQSLRHSMAS
jgi:hypothetical protein